LDKQSSDGTPGQARAESYDFDGAHGQGEVGGPRVFEILGTPAVLDCLPRQRLLELGVVFGLWNETVRPSRAAADGRPVGRDLEVLSKPELIALLAARRSLTARALWYALTTAERIKVLSNVPTL
jgi:hypothetical protein